jgi:hypothetical protein
MKRQRRSAPVQPGISKGGGMKMVTRTQRMFVSPLLFGVVVVSACNGKSRPPAEVETRHPVASFIVGASPNDPTVSINDPSPLDSTASVSFGGSVRQIGAAERPPEQVFGAVTGLAQDRSGHLYVLDTRLGQVSVFDSLGRRTEVIGRPGRGPGEFMRALSIALRDDSTLYVGDVSEQVHIFRRIGSAGFTYDSSFSTGVSVDAMCFMGGDLYVHGVSPTDSFVIRRYDVTSGRQVAAFGRVYKSPHPRANMEITRGLIACNDSLGLIAYAPQSVLGEARAYRASGEQVWRSVIKGFEPIGMITTPSSFQALIPPDGFDRIDALVWLPDSTVLLQVAHVTSDPAVPRSATHVSRITTFRIAAASGRARRVPQELQQIVLASGSTLISAAEEPFPMVSLRHFRLTRGLR